MRYAPVILLGLLSLNGCLATGNLIQLGKKSEYNFTISSVRRADSEPSYLVEYTATVGLSTIGSGNSEHQRFQVLTPGKPTPPRLVECPPGYSGNDGDNLVRIKRVKSSSGVGVLPDGQADQAIVVNREHLILLTRDDPRDRVTRTDFTFTTLNYREPYVYPLIAAGLPVALAIDTVTFPLQVCLMASAFSQPAPSSSQ